MANKELNGIWQAGFNKKLIKSPKKEVVVDGNIGNVRKRTEPNTVQQIPLGDHMEWWQGCQMTTSNEILFLPRNTSIPTKLFIPLNNHQKKKGCESSLLGMCY